MFEPVLALLDEPNLTVYRYWDERPQPVRATHPDIPTIVYSVPGVKAVVVATSYSDQETEVTLDVDCNKLGLPTDCAVHNAETGEALPLQAGRVKFGLKKHDAKVLLFEGADR